MNQSTVAVIAIFIAVACGSAHADTVTDWNQTAIEIMKVAKVSANPWSRTLAMMHVAMSDAINEGSLSVTSMVRIQDVLNPTAVNIYRALAGGVTTLNILHGSANTIGGQNAVVKLKWGRPVNEMMFPGIAQEFAGAHARHRRNAALSDEPHGSG